MDWRADLAGKFDAKKVEDEETKDQVAQRRKTIAEWISSVAEPALNEIKVELEKRGRTVKVGAYAQSASITVSHNGFEELDLAIAVDPARSLYPTPVKNFTDLTDGKRYRSEGTMQSGSQSYTIANIGKEDVIAYVLREYRPRSG